MNCLLCGSETSVIETRAIQAGSVMKRRRACSVCSFRFWSFEIDAVMWRAIPRSGVFQHAFALQRRQVRAQRNARILVQLAAGEKHAVVAAEFGLSDSMVSIIARHAGVASYRAQRMASRVAA